MRTTVTLPNQDPRPDRIHSIGVESDPSRQQTRPNTKSIEKSVTWMLLALAALFISLITIVIKDALDARVTKVVDRGNEAQRTESEPSPQILGN